MRRHRVAALGALSLLQVYTLVAGLAVARLGIAPASARPTGPYVIERPVVGPTAGLPALGTGEQGSGAGPGFGPTRAGLAARLAPLLDDADLGGRVAAAVADSRGRRILYSARGDQGFVPASTTKLVTGAAALAALGPDTRFATRVVRGAAPDEIILVGGGDPTLVRTRRKGQPYPRPATLADLAEATARALRQAGGSAGAGSEAGGGTAGRPPVRVRLAYDTGLYTGPELGPGWDAGLAGEGNVAPVSPLMVDGGRLRPTDLARGPAPAAAAAAAFASALKARGVAVLAPPARAEAAPDAAELARVGSPPVSALVERMIDESDNDIAEALGRHIAAKQGRPASFAGLRAAVAQVVARLGVTRGVSVFDGSGLSRHNRISPAALVRLLALAASPDRPDLRPLISGLPVAGFSGTLSDRFGATGSTAGVGAVRAKTGFLNGVTTLAGIAQDRDGRLLAFAFMADDVSVRASLGAQDALDRLATALTRCGCRT